MVRAIFTAAALLLGLVGVPANADPAPVQVVLAPAKEARRMVLAQVVAPKEFGAGPFTVTKGIDRTFATQADSVDGGTRVRWLLDEVLPGESPQFELALGRGGGRGAPAIDVKHDAPAGELTVKRGADLLTRYCYGQPFAQFHKPFFYPITLDGISMVRGFPMEKKPGEQTDHPHHTGLFFAHGEVNGIDYWTKGPITNDKIAKVESGDVFGRIVAENSWGDDLAETQDVLVLNVPNAVVMDWTITLKAKKDVTLGKTKEGGFGLRVPTELTSPEPGKKQDKTRGHGQMVDALGNKGEVDIRAKAAMWADNFGEVDGKKVGVAIITHPDSFRAPSNWHVRNYGLFANNAFFMAGEHKMKQGESITFKYRIYFHHGDPAEAHVAEVANGYAEAKAEISK